MDITTLLGLIGIVLMVVIGFVSGSISAILFNLHGLILVCGGTTIAMLINTPMEQIFDTVRSLRILIVGQDWARPRPVVAAMITASQEVHSKGIGALRAMDPKIGGGFASRAAQIALEFNNADYVYAVLDNEVTQDLERKNEVVNIFRTMSVLLPMFGLVGTLIGIVDVLKHISNPEEVGSAMAVAVTTAFYGILLANLVAIPVAGKLRIRYAEEYLMKRIVIEAITQMLKGTMPVALERRLQAYLPE